MAEAGGHLNFEYVTLRREAVQFGVWGNINRIVNRSPEHQAQHPGPAKREVIGGMDTVSNDMAKLNKISNAMIFLTFFVSLIR